MKLSSEKFMDEMLKDNTPVSAPSGIPEHEKLEKMIDEKLDGMWKKFQEEVSSMIPTSPKVETPEESNVDNSVDNVDNEGSEE